MSEPVPGTGTPDVVDPAVRVAAGPLTGDEAVDEALRRLVDVEEQALRDQVGVFEDVHGALRDRLADAEG